MLTQGIDAEKWAAKVMEQISTDMQKAAPGFKRFLLSELIKMKQFYGDYQPVVILPSATAELANMNGEASMPPVTAELLK